MVARLKIEITPKAVEKLIRSKPLGDTKVFQIKTAAEDLIVNRKRNGINPTTFPKIKSNILAEKVLSTLTSFMLPRN